MSIVGLFAKITPGAEKPDTEYERRYKLVSEADSLASGHFTEYAHAVCQTKMLAEILAILATREYHGN